VAVPPKPVVTRLGSSVSCLRRPVSAGFRELALLFSLGLSFVLAGGSTAGGFVENLGQFSSEVRYLARCQGADVYLTDQAVVFDLRLAGHALWMRFQDGNVAPRFESLDERPARFSYFSGNDPTTWRGGVASYGAVTIRDLWPGFDLRLRLEGDQLVYEVDPAAPGVSSEAPSVTWLGVHTVRAGGDGVLRLAVPGAILTDSPHGGVGAAEERAELDRKAATGGGGEWRGRCEAAWSRAPRSAMLGQATQLPVGVERTLAWTTEAKARANGPTLGPRPDELGAEEGQGGRRDPIPSPLDWSTFIGGSNNDYAHAMELALQDCPVLVGYTKSANFPTTAGAYDRTHAGHYDAYVAKSSPDASTLLWATFIGGSAEDRPFSTVIDHLQRVVLVGGTYSADFPTTAGAYDRALAGARDVFVCRLSGDGRSLLWSTYLGGGGEECSWTVTLDSSDRPVLVGRTNSTDFPTTDGAFARTCAGGTDGFAAKLSTDGSTVVWSTYLGGSVFDTANLVVMAPGDRPLISGTTTSSNFPVTEGTVGPANSGAADAFLVRLTEDAAALELGTYLGGWYNEENNGLALLPDGRIVLAGMTASPNFPVTPGAYDTEYADLGDVFVTELDPQARTVLWSTYLGGADLDVAMPVTVDAQGCLLVTGETSSPDFPTTADAFDRTYAGARDIFVCRLDPTGSGLLWSTFAGGSQWESGWDLEIDSAGGVQIAGATRSTDFPTTPGAYDRTYGGGEEDSYLMRFIIPAASAVPPPRADREIAPDPRVVVCPNPFNSSLSFEAPGASFAHVRLVDVLGRTVTSAEAGSLIRQGDSWLWQVADRGGHALRPGVYWLLLDGRQRIPGPRVTCVR